MTTAIILAALLVGWLIQLYLSYRQAMAFNRAVQGLRHAGTVSVGAGGQRFRGGRAFVALAVDGTGLVRDSLTLSGWTTAARPKGLPAVLGRHVDQIAAGIAIPGISKKQREAAQQAAELMGRNWASVTN